MKSKLKRLMMLLCLCAVASLSFVSCSDDDEVMGAIAINSCQATDTEVTIYWTLVPNSNCDGYKITLYRGTRANLGEVVEDLTFGYRESVHTFTGLTPSTDYVIRTEGIPSASSGFSSADVYWKEFTTAASN